MSITIDSINATIFKVCGAIPLVPFTANKSDSDEVIGQAWHYNIYMYMGRCMDEREK